MYYNIIVQWIHEKHYLEPQLTLKIDFFILFYFNLSVSLLIILYVCIYKTNQVSFFPIEIYFTALIEWESFHVGTYLRWFGLITTITIELSLRVKFINKKSVSYLRQNYFENNDFIKYSDSFVGVICYMRNKTPQTFALKILYFNHMST